MKRKLIFSFIFLAGALSAFTAYHLSNDIEFASDNIQASIDKAADTTVVKSEETLDAVTTPLPVGVLTTEEEIDAGGTE